MRTPTLGALASTAVLALAVTGCGTNNEESSATPTNTTAVKAAVLDQAIAGKIPASELKTPGTVSIGIDPTYAPNEFLASDGKTVIGMDPDIAKAIGTVTGLKVKFVVSSFDGILAGIGNKFDIGMSSFTDSKEREQKFDFATYFTAGSSFFVKTDGGPDIKTVADLCGYTVAVQKGTTQADEAGAQAKKCPSGKKLDVAVSPDQASANTALASGRADVGYADSPIAAYQVKQKKGQFKLSGEPQDSAPYGIAFKQGSKLAPAFQEAIQKLMDDGVYVGILKRWGVESGAIDTSVVNGATS